jgi:glycosyltransferase involved in cell wall biosynthesis
MKILFFVESLRSGGAQRQVVELIKGLKQYDDIECILVLTADNVHYTEIYDSGVTIHYLIRKNKFDLTIFFKFYKLCKTVEPDVIHSWNSMCSFYAIPTKIINRIPLINGFLRSAPPKLQVGSRDWLGAKFTFPFSDIILANSKAGLQAYNATKRKAVYIHNGFDIARINEIQDVKSVKLEFDIQTTYVVGMVATFLDYKDYASFTKIAIKIVNERDDVTFLAIGEGKNLEKCMNMVPHHLKCKIKFLGRQQGVEKFIQLFSIGVLLSSAIHGEGIANSIMEYMAFEKPVIATKSGGNKELVIDGQTGYLIDIGDTAKLYLYINKLLNDVSFSYEIGRAGRIRLEKEFGLLKMTDNYMDLYTALINR